jgi:TRAP transporter TAXI family solute receptor
MRSWKPRLVLVLLLLVATLAGCGLGPEDERRPLVIGSGQKGTTFLSYGEAMQTVFRSSIDDHDPVIKPSNGSPDNTRLVAKDPNAVGIVQSTVAADALQGHGQFQQPITDLRVLANLYSSYVQLVTLPERGIRSVGDLKGKRVSVGSKGSGTEVNAVHVLETLGLMGGRDVEVMRLSATDSFDALRSGKIDAMFRSDGVPAPGIAKLAEERTVALMPLDELVRQLQQQHGGQAYLAATIPGGTYAGIAKPTATLRAPNLLVVNRAMDPDLAYRLTKALFERKTQLVGMEREAEHLDQLGAQEVAPLELHPGAARYYDEILR